MTEERHKLEISSERVERATIVHLKGEIDLRTSPQLREALINLLEDVSGKIVLDLAGVSYVDSSGVGTIVELKRRVMRAKGDVILVALQQRVRSLFEITRLDKFFILVDTIEEALAA